MSVLVCGRCGKDTKVAATAHFIMGGYAVKRTRTCETGHEFSTYEIPEAIIGGIKEAMFFYVKGAKRAAAYYERNIAIYEKVKGGMMVKTVAKEYGVAENTVSCVLKKFGYSVRQDESRRAHNRAVPIVTPPQGPVRKNDAVRSLRLRHKLEAMAVPAPRIKDRPEIDTQGIEEHMPTP